MCRRIYLLPSSWSNFDFIVVFYLGKDALKFILAFLIFTNSHFSPFPCVSISHEMWSNRLAKIQASHGASTHICLSQLDAMLTKLSNFMTLNMNTFVVISALGCVVLCAQKVHFVQLCCKVTVSDWLISFSSSISTFDAFYSSSRCGDCNFRFQICRFIWVDRSFTFLVRSTLTLVDS